MRWSYPLGRVAGIPIRAHLTFLLLLGAVGLGRLRAGAGWAGAALGVSLLLMVFSVILLHELGHALAARRFGIPTRDITLLPVGGLARLARMPADPRQELVVAAAGPAVNALLAPLLWLAQEALGQVPWLAQEALGRGGVAPALGVARDLLGWLGTVNVVLLLFNLIPAFPMDGGRLLRAALSLRLGALEATGTAVRWSRRIALLLGLFGLFKNPMLILIAIFVWVSGARELAMVRRQALAGEHAGTPDRPEVILPGQAIGSPFTPGRGGVTFTWPAPERPAPEATAPGPQPRVIDVP